MAWLRRHVPSQLSDRRIEEMAEAALQAAAAQTIRLPAQEVTARLIAQLATDLLVLDRRIKELDKTIGQRLAAHPQATIICSLPAMGPLLAAELLVAVGDLGSFPDAGHLAAYGGLAPVPRDSGRRTNNLHPPKRYHRSLRRVFYLSALSSLSVPRSQPGLLPAQTRPGTHPPAGPDSSGPPSRGRVVGVAARQPLL